MVEKSKQKIKIQTQNKAHFLLFNEALAIPIILSTLKTSANKGSAVTTGTQNPPPNKNIASPQRQIKIEKTPHSISKIYLYYEFQ